jgi:hypothetical protein
MIFNIHSFFLGISFAFILLTAAILGDIIIARIKRKKDEIFRNELIEQNKRDLLRKYTRGPMA